MLVNILSKYNRNGRLWPCNWCIFHKVCLIKLPYLNNKNVYFLMSTAFIKVNVIRGNIEMFRCDISFKKSNYFLTPR